MVNGKSRSQSASRQSCQNKAERVLRTQIKIDSIPEILPSFHCVQAQNMVLLNDTKIR